MAEYMQDFDSSKPHSIINAELLREDQIHVIIDKSEGEKGFGPWSLVIDHPPSRANNRGIGPPPVDTALSALAA